MDAAARLQDRGDGTNTQRLEKGCRRRTRRGIARSDSGGGATKPAVRGRAQGRDAVAGAARRHCRGGRIPRDGGSCASPAGGTPQDRPRIGGGRLLGAAAFARLRAAQAAVPHAGAVTKGLWCGCVMLALAGCATPPRPAPPTLSEEPSSVAALAAAIEADAKRSDHEPDSKIRGDLAAEADRHADACLARQPQYPPNLLALAEALAKTGDANGARENYAQARDTALALPAAVDRDQWLREADQGLKRR